jgi:predicted HicB family RNase H-like nuclease
MGKRETVSLRIDLDIWKRARKHAIDKDMSMSELVEKALKNELKID